LLQKYTIWVGELTQSMN